MQSEVLEWPTGFTGFCARFAHRFSRVDRGGGWARERKNRWTLAEAAGDAGPDGMQRLLNF
ncbi:hypothetical protein RW1_005_00850 [Rhodococcus wratislaviensis NBRC 100605]|uniref:Uncharacterized protein n=1 Tax=Rhodococcus wratislaviensis NBRC 100605 TaxID=1219028 RepID=X0QWN3_RHOWR|nr:hypothetical protein RW1_005_00850 [Rhodococcus wratislaviensis NBRC 100605]